MLNSYKPTTYESPFLFATNADYIEELYVQYLNDPKSVSLEWQNYFKDYDNEQIITKRKTAPKISPIQQVQDSSSIAKIWEEHYKSHAHFMATLDPLGLEKLPTEQDLHLNPEAFGLSASEVAEQHNILRNKYTKTLAIQCSYIEDESVKQWLYSKFEDTYNINLSSETKKKLLQSLIHTENFEQYLHVKFLGSKRFSIEGGDATIPALQVAIDKAAELGVQKTVIGMAHRGRLNVLVNVLGKSLTAMLSEFQGNPAHPEDLDITGDVKYHLGFSNKIKTINNRDMVMSLMPNPSHLEAVNPVVAGKVRAEQDYINDTERCKVMGILLHGDASFAGQGVVSESLLLSKLAGYKCGGIIHIITNNQIGFTTSPEYGRPSRYPSDVAKSIQAPVLHVNGDDIEAVTRSILLASNYRATFQQDIVINLVCYRKYGHNEGDEPMFTQPIMYEAIQKKKSPALLYSEQLINSNIVTQSDIDNITNEFKQQLDKAHEESKSYRPKEGDWLKDKWQNIVQIEDKKSVESITGVEKKTLHIIGQALCNIPKNIELFGRMDRLLKAKQEMFDKEESIDWSTAEALAFGSLLLENIPIRLSGQDSGRGTFSHRNSVLRDLHTEEKYIPLNNIAETQALYEVVDSPLSEYAVMGFEYGYSTTYPKSLVMWEGQFGDFANGAQIMIDQFISAAETKWQRMSGLVLLLPHGYEGQGPEHSSARLERYLQLCAGNNMYVVNCTTPASYFHILRRQIHRNFRKPLIVMTPKSLLRHKLAVSNLSGMSENTQFIPVLDDILTSNQATKISRVVLCSGKVYYDLLEARDKKQINNIALVRLEQLYPYPAKEILDIISSYKNAEIVWCQEEPKNMGAWSYIYHYLRETLTQVKHKASDILYVGRPGSASTSTGYNKIHAIEQTKLIEEALTI